MIAKSVLLVVAKHTYCADVGVRQVSSLVINSVSNSLLNMSNMKTIPTNHQSSLETRLLARRWLDTFCVLFCFAMKNRTYFCRFTGIKQQFITNTRHSKLVVYLRHHAARAADVSVAAATNQRPQPMPRPIISVEPGSASFVQWERV